MLQELDACLAICARLEDLFQQDMDEIAKAVTGEIHDAYVDSVTDAMEAVKEIKNHITVLLGYEM